MIRFKNVSAQAISTMSPGDIGSFTEAQAEGLRKWSKGHGLIVELKDGDENGPAMPAPRVVDLSGMKEDQAISLIEIEESLQVLSQYASHERRKAVTDVLNKRAQTLIAKGHPVKP